MSRPRCWRQQGASRQPDCGCAGGAATAPLLTAAYTRFVGRHALAPGHGKTVIAAYLVGQRGTPRQAVWLGATVTATHTAGVLLLGAVLSLTTVPAPERLLPATEIASGLLLAGVGGYLLRGS